MPKVDLDEDLYLYVQQHEQVTGERVSDYLRRVLKDQMKGSEVRVSTRSGTDLAEFLAILSEIHRKYPDRFSRLMGVRGRTRIYFALSAEEIEQSGSSTAPVKIPGTNYWASSNNATALKRTILQKVFRAIGCEPEEVRKWLQQFNGAEVFSVEEAKWLEKDSDDPTKI